MKESDSLKQVTFERNFFRKALEDARFALIAHPVSAELRNAAAYDVISKALAETAESRIARLERENVSLREQLDVRPEASR